MKLRLFAPLAFAVCVVVGCEEKKPLEPFVPVTVQVVPSQVPQMTVGQTIQLIAIVTAAANTTVTWSSSAPSVATVSAAGTVTCVSPGLAVITATSVQDPAARGAVTVQCVAPVQAISITTTPTSLSFTHQVNTTACPQVVGTVEVTNTSAIEVQVTVVTHFALAVDVTAFTLAPGASRTVTVRFTCATQTSFVGNVGFEATGGGASDVKTVQVTGTIN